MIHERNGGGAGGADSKRKREREREHSGTWLFMQGTEGRLSNTRNSSSLLWEVRCSLN
uniref:Uncharacterized protein n=1 Tax=Salix viminalis TaxID=40686 RepID=A0A6N2M452_SALVM